MKKQPCLIVFTPDPQNPTLHPIGETPITIDTKPPCTILLPSLDPQVQSARISPHPLGALLRNADYGRAIQVNSHWYEEFLLYHYDALHLQDNSQTVFLARYLECIPTQKEKINPPTSAEIQPADIEPNPPEKPPQDIEPLSTLLGLHPFYAQVKSLRAPGALLIFDIDKFKSVNDTFGFFGGDCVIRMIGLAIRSVCSTPCIAGRISGDRFAVVIPQGDLTMAAYLAEQVRAVVEQVDFYQTGTTIRAIVSVQHDFSRETIWSVAEKLYKKPRNQVYEL